MKTLTLPIIIIFSLLLQETSAQKAFQQPKTISQVVGKMNFENKEWAYRNSPQYEMKFIFNDYVIKAYRSKASAIQFEQNCFCPSYYALSIITKPPFDKSLHTYQSLWIGEGDWSGPFFFCRVENRFEKSTKIPLRVRVGSLGSTNYLERKKSMMHS